MASKRKLTLSVDAEVIERARRYSKVHRTSISQLVTTFLDQLDGRDVEGQSPLVARIRGVLPSDVSIEEYRRHLDETHR